MPDDPTTTPLNPSTPDPGPTSGGEEAPSGAGPRRPGPSVGPGNLTRSRTDRMVAGVAGGLAERLDVDPLIVRAAFVALIVFGGSGLLLYLAGWLLLPEEGEWESIAARAVKGGAFRRPRPRHTVLAVLVMIAILAAVRPWHRAVGFPGVAVVALLVVAAASRHRQSAPPLPPSGFAFHGPEEGGAGPASDFPGDDLLGRDATAGAYPGAYGSSPPGDQNAWWPPVAAPRPPSLVPVLLGALAVLVVVSSAINATGWVSVPLPAVVAVGLVMGVAALVAGAVRGRIVGSTLILMALAGALILSAAVPHPLGGGIGERTWHPADASELRPSYRLGTGQATLDLRDIPTGGPTRVVRASVGSGDLTVTVADGTAVRVRERCAFGRTDILGAQQSGVSVDQTSIQPGGQAPTLGLALRVGIGSIEVRRAAA